MFFLIIPLPCILLSFFFIEQKEFITGYKIVAVVLVVQLDHPTRDLMLPIGRPNHMQKVYHSCGNKETITRDKTETKRQCCVCVGGVLASAECRCNTRGPVTISMLRHRRQTWFLMLRSWQNMYINNQHEDMWNYLYALQTAHNTEHLRSQSRGSAGNPSLIWPFRRCS